MKTGLSKLSEEYLTALRKHTKPGAQAGVPSAVRLGRQAVALGLETLDLARIHELALATLTSPGSPAGARKQIIKQAKAFFLEAIAPIEQTHRPARKTDAHVQQLNQTLRRRTAESSDSARHLRRGIAQRQAAEVALKKSGKQRQRLLAESGRLQAHSRHLTHKILSAQENEWQQVSRQLHDEIAQTLLGIQVRLLALKRAAKANTGNLKKEIASTQRLVKQSVRNIQKFAHEFGLHHEP
jgi:signal transduction histidine kinase